VTSGTRLRRASLLAATVALVAALVAPASAAAADPTFQPATATSTFLEAITVQQEATLPAGVQRIEALVRTGDGSRTFLADVPNPGAGPVKLTYRFDTPSGGIYPNTKVELGFRVTLADGATIDGPTTTIRYEDTRYQWKTLEGDLVRIHWVQGDQGFGERALRIGDEAVKNAADLLGVTEKDPVDFFVNGDRDAF
jgi:hypothetical protein